MGNACDVRMYRIVIVFGVFGLAGCVLPQTNGSLVGAISTEKLKSIPTYDLTFNDKNAPSTSNFGIPP